jgi:hypothetical protein
VVLSSLNLLFFEGMAFVSLPSPPLPIRLFRSLLRACGFRSLVLVIRPGVYEVRISRKALRKGNARLIPIRTDFFNCETVKQLFQLRPITSENQPPFGSGRFQILIGRVPPSSIFQLSFLKVITPEKKPPKDNSPLDDTFVNIMKLAAG